MHERSNRICVGWTDRWLELPVLRALGCIDRTHEESRLTHFGLSDRRAERNLPRRRSRCNRREYFAVFAGLAPETNGQM